jgi:serine phosphatase RsbU (regulator of sigma subunit)
MAVIIISIIQFAIHFINVRSLSKLWYYVLKTVATVAGVLLVMALVTWNYWISIISTNMLTGIAAVLGFLATAYFAFFKKSRQALFFFASFALFLVGVITVVLYYRGVVPGTVLTVNGVYIGAAFQVITLSLGLADRINGMKNELSLLNTGLELKVEERTAEFLAINDEMLAINQSLVDARDALWSEMQLARNIQAVLLPHKPEIPGYEVTAWMEPADHVGGDYYDIINAGAMNWIAIGDVSGHGMPAGLVMMMAQTCIAAIIAGNPRLSPSEVLTQANRTLYANIQKLSEDKYMTITVLAAHDRGRFVFSGLHQDILVYRHDWDDIETVETDGMWVGLSDDISSRLTDESLVLTPGDCMLLYTDGITEAWEKGSVKDQRDPERAMFGSARLKELFKANALRPLDEIKKALLSALKDYDCDDDVTFMLIRKTG